LKRALIGYTGFVGSTLQNQSNWTHFYNSKNISEIENKEFEEIYCSGISAQKWLANKEPAEDLAKIEVLQNHLKSVKCKKFILISTVDVFNNPININENSKITIEKGNFYGKHRYLFEEFIKNTFNNVLIVRLPGLVGNGLKKNILFDFKHNNPLDKIDSRNIFQFYPMKNLYQDIQIALDNDLSLIHLTSEPLQVADIAKECFDLDFQNKLDKPLVKYDFQSIHAHLWGCDKYQYSASEALQEIKRYAQF
jgi:hypothetical protein